MSNLLQRIITALLGVAIMITAIVYGSISFALLFLIIMILTLLEFYGLAKASGSKPFEYWGVLFSTLLFGLSFAVIAGHLQSVYLWFLPPILLLCFIFPLYKTDGRHPIHCLAITLFGIIYVSLPFTLMVKVAYTQGSYDFSLIIGLLLAQWASDSGAYIAGRTMGKTKLFERVSPKKTWEGTIGGGVLSLAILYGWSLYFDSLNTVQWLVLALIVGVFGSLGDLVESLFKRSLSIKDSGSSIPGHGGFLDRFDGLIISLPFATAYLILLQLL